MKVLLSWLREFAPIEGDPYELADHMSDLGMAVEETRPLNPLKGVVVARVASLRPPLRQTEFSWLMLKLSQVIRCRFAVVRSTCQKAT